MTRATLILSIVLAVSTFGCGDGTSVKTGTVQGKVLLKGQPLTKGTIFFSFAAGGDSASGTIQSDGSYTLRHEKGLSVPVGDYTVSVLPDAGGGEVMDPMALNEKFEKEGLPKPADSIPAKYTDAKTSGLIAVVKEGQNTHDFDLK